MKILWNNDYYHNKFFKGLEHINQEDTTLDIHAHINNVIKELFMHPQRNLLWA